MKTKQNFNSRRGFTLIELLVVIAIIGILAGALLVGLGGARESARDARRVSDLRQVQTSLELYFNRCAGYPGSSTCVADASVTWTELGTALASVGVASIPNDPSSGATYEYVHNGTGTALGQSYILKAILENDNAVLDNDIDGTPFGGITCGTGVPVESPFAYCVSL